MRKLLVLPAWCNSLGGTTVSLLAMASGFKHCNASDQVCILVQAGSLLEKYLQQAGHGAYLQLIAAQGQQQFVKRALSWVSEQPTDWPLLLDNCVNRKLLPILSLAAPKLRLSGRPVYHFFHDLARSYNPLGNLARRFTFACLSPGAICNSQFTAKHIRDNLLPKIQGILHQPIDVEQFNDHPASNPPPVELQPILDSGARLMLTPSRISKPGAVNDKNLRALLPVLAELKASGYHYHGVLIGQDSSSGQTRAAALLEQAKHLGVTDCFTILPPTFAIKDYYNCADIVVALSPREPFGRTVIEAIACGVPVVGSKTGGIGEILHHFAPEWAVDPHDPTATAKAIVCIASDPNTPKALAQAKHWVSTQCSSVSYARKMIEITGLNQTSA